MYYVVEGNNHDYFSTYEYIYNALISMKYEL